MSSASAQQYTPAEYLVRERAAEYKSEYVNGFIVAMTGASRAHNVITANVGGEVRVQLKGRPCEVYIAGMRVKVSLTGAYRYPDIVVACGDIAFEDAELDTLLNPVLIVEVLSPTTEAADRGEKFAHYRRLASLQEYLLVAQDVPRIEQFVRQGMAGSSPTSVASAPQSASPRSTVRSRCARSMTRCSSPEARP